MQPDPKQTPSPISPLGSRTDTWLKKTMRYLKRERSTTTTVTAIMMGAGAVLGAVVIAMNGPALVAAGLVAGVGAIAVAVADEHTKVTRNELMLNGNKIVGAAEDLTRINAMQWMINSWAANFQHSPSLPQSMEDALSAHLFDILGAIERVKVYDGKGRQLKSVTFVRDAYDKNGKPAKEDVAVIDAAPVTEPQEPRATLPHSAVPQFALKANKPQEPANDRPYQLAPRPRNRFPGML